MNNANGSKNPLPLIREGQGVLFVSFQKKNKFTIIADNNLASSEYYHY